VYNTIDVHIPRVCIVFFIYYKGIVIIKRYSIDSQRWKIEGFKWMLRLVFHKEIILYRCVEIDSWLLERINIIYMSPPNIISCTLYWKISILGYRIIQLYWGIDIGSFLAIMSFFTESMFFYFCDTLSYKEDVWNSKKANWTKTFFIFLF